MSKAQEVAKGFTCVCGRFNKFAMYVYAHWSIELIFNCQCDRAYVVFEGEVQDL